MENHMYLSDHQFESQFAARQFDVVDFTHEAHLRLAWIQITRDGVKLAQRNVQKQLKEFVTSVGTENRYHTTITVAAVKAVHHFINKS